MNREEIRKSIEPNSTQINADDLIAGPLTVTVRQVKRGPSAEQPVEIVIDGHRPYRPCKSMRRVLIACWGDNGSDWVGRSMTLFADPTVRFGGVAVGGIRISHVSHIERDMSLMLTTTRSKRTESVIKRLDSAPKTYPQEDFEKNSQSWVKAINSGKLSITDVISKAAKTGALTSEQIERLESLVAGSATDLQSDDDSFAKHRTGILQAATEDEILDWIESSKEGGLSQEQRMALDSAVAERRRQLAEQGS